MRPRRSLGSSDGEQRGEERFCHAEQDHQPRACLRAEGERLSMDDMYRDYILDHYKNPRNAGEHPGATHTYHDSNPLCGDELTMQLRIDDGHVEDVRLI